MERPIQLDLAPFVETNHGRGMTLEVRDRGDGTFEISVSVPGHGTKQGGVLTVTELFNLGRAITLAASKVAKQTFEALPAFVVTGRGAPA